MLGEWSRWSLPAEPKERTKERDARPQMKSGSCGSRCHSNTVQAPRNPWLSQHRRLDVRFWFGSEIGYGGGPDITIGASTTLPQRSRPFVKTSYHAVGLIGLPLVLGALSSPSPSLLLPQRLLMPCPFRFMRINAGAEPAWGRGVLRFPALATGSRYGIGAGAGAAKWRQCGAEQEERNR